MNWISELDKYLDTMVKHGIRLDSFKGIMCIKKKLYEIYSDIDRVDILPDGNGIILVSNGKVIDKITYTDKGLKKIRKEANYDN